MEGFLSLWHRPYDLYRQPGHRRIFALFFAGFAWFMLFVFGVFDFDYFGVFERLYLTGIYALACWLASMLNFFIIQKAFFKRYTFGNTVLLSLSIMVTIGIFNYLLTTLLFRWEPFSLMVFLKNQFFTLSIGMIIAPFVILAHYSYLMRRQARRLSTITSIIPEAMILLESDYKHGNLELNERDLLFIHTADNYVDVYYLDGKNIQHSLVRTTLSSVEKAIASQRVLKCHRSYIVNLHHVNSCKRPVSELRLQFGGKEYLIPVSRNYRERIRKALEHP
jgi:hypothetical protein